MPIHSRASPHREDRKRCARGADSAGSFRVLSTRSPGREPLRERRLDERRGSRIADRVEQHTGSTPTTIHRTVLHLADNPQEAGMVDFRGTIWDDGAVSARFLTLADVAETLSISASQAYALVRSGDLPAIKVGGRGQWRVENSELEKYIQRMYEQTRTFIESSPDYNADQDPSSDFQDAR